MARLRFKVGVRLKRGLGLCPGEGAGLRFDKTRQFEGQLEVQCSYDGRLRLGLRLKLRLKLRLWRTVQHFECGLSPG